MNVLKPLNFRSLIVIGAIATVAAVFLFSIIFTPKMDEPEMEASDQKHEPVLESPKQPSTVGSPTAPSQADIEAAITALENLDVTVNRDESVQSTSDEISSETQVTDSRDKTPLSYEEELRQRYIRIKETPEYKEISGKINNLTMEFYELGAVETPATDAWLAFTKNPYLIFGYTKAEGREMEWLPEEVEIMRLEQERLRQEWEKERDELRAIIDANQRERTELNQQRLELLGMAKDEYYIARGIKPSPPPPSKLPEF